MHPTRSMTTPRPDHLAELLADQDGPRISLYLPTGRYQPTRLEERIQYRGLIREAEQSLRMEHKQDLIDTLLAPLVTLAEDESFWAHIKQGLAVFRSQDLMTVYRLQRPVPRLAIVADSFHIKPLLRIMQSADAFAVLALTGDHVRLFTGNRDGLDEVHLHHDVPRSLVAALGNQLTEPVETAAGVGKTGHAVGSYSMRHAVGSREDEVDKDTEKFFRIIDRAIIKHHTQPDGTPLILAALPQHQPVFRTVSHNPQLWPEGITGNPDAFTVEELREKAWVLMRPRYLARLQQVLDDFGAAEPRALASDAVEAIALAALGGRVRTLLVDQDRLIPGRIDQQTGQVHFGQLEDPHTDDVLDELAEMTLRTGGEVIIAPGERMPTGTGIAAVYRF
ncbi:MAG: hypothetical protein RLZZ621_139 [Gemmatimonadota bacterium]